MHKEMQETLWTEEKKKLEMQGSFMFLLCLLQRINKLVDGNRHKKPAEMHVSFLKALERIIVLKHKNYFLTHFSKTK